ncbi:hypothetical protein FKM82_009460 [Ascaphus truei]
MPLQYWTPPHYWIAASLTLGRSQLWVRSLWTSSAWAGLAGAPGRHRSGRADDITSGSAGSASPRGTQNKAPSGSSSGKAATGSCRKKKTSCPRFSLPASTEAS